MTKKTKTPATRAELESEIRSLKRRLGVAQKNAATLAADKSMLESHRRRDQEDMTDARDLLDLASEARTERNRDRLTELAGEILG